MFRYVKNVLVVICSLLIVFSSTALASEIVTPDTIAKLRIQTIATHGEIAIYNTRVGNWGKLLVRRVSSRYPHSTNYLVVLENEAHASVLRHTIKYLNYRTQYQTGKGYLFYLNPISPISTMVMSELLEQGFTRDAKMFLMSVKGYNLPQDNKDKKK